MGPLIVLAVVTAQKMDYQWVAHCYGLEPLKWLGQWNELDLGLSLELHWALLMEPHLEANLASMLEQHLGTQMELHWEKYWVANWVAN